MTRLLLKKTIHESSLLFLACASMLFAFCWARVWIICQFDLQQFKPLLEQLRPFEKFSPVPLEQLLTYTGSLAMTYHEPVLMLCILVWSISRGSDVVSGEINRGTMEMLLAQPISRIHLLGCHALVCVSGGALLCLIGWLGLLVGIQTNSIRETVAPTVEVSLPFIPVRFPIRVGAAEEFWSPLAAQVDASVFVAPSCNLFALSFFVYSLSVLCSSFDRYRWRTLGIMIGIFVFQLLLMLLSKATEWTAVWGYFTFLSAYQPDSIVHFSRSAPASAWWFFVPVAYRSTSWPHPLGPLGLTSLLLLLGSLFLVIAAWRFRSRDIPAPL